MRRRVVVTGMGAVTPLGTTVPQLWANLKEAKSGVDFTTLFDASNFPTRISAEVKNWSLADVGEDPKVWEKRGRHTKFAIGAARQAVNESGVLGTVDPDRFGVYLGAGEGQQDFYNFSHMMVAALKNGELDLAAFIQEGLKRLDRSSSSNKNRTCRSRTWPRTSARKARISIASRHVRQAARRSAKPPKSFAAARPM
ncbi:MAG TPA: beta-ketoacyl synthase N-terminal-like domain-containing protein [Lacipirellulaceae bacterium]|nr:beta-ketoacyl synthase N-terminal-like domain-containing protein [Lacipirellulaceae bacterium]